MVFSQANLSLAEKIEILFGSRVGNQRKAAVRMEDLDAILKLEPVKAEPIAAAPTMEQYNKLLKDVAATNEALRSVATAMQRKILR